MHISYFIPEDGDASDHPNVFTCDCAASKLTLAILRKVSTSGHGSEHKD